MATTTERFGFTLPAGVDNASILPLNLNMQIVEQYLGATQDMIAPLYDDTVQYSVGDIVNYDNGLYKCIADIETPESWDEDKWERVYATEVGGGGGTANVVPNPEGTPTDTLSTIGIDDVIYDIAGGGGSGNYYNPIIYSEEEREVGVNYNNYPLYQRTLKFTRDTRLTANTWTTTEFSASNLKNIVQAFIQNEAPASITVSAGIVSGNIALNSPRQIEIKPSDTDTYLTIQYTKTTDTAGSGSYNTLGVPMCHYSEDEQVVGTWIDGAIIYQKTIVYNNINKTSTDGALLDMLSGIDTFVDIECVATLSNGNNINNNFHLDNSYMFNIYGNSSSGDVRYRALWSNTTFSKVVVTYKYTKSSS